MTPASRPCLPAYLSDAPDYVTPALVLDDDEIRRAYDTSMARSWEAIGKLKALGVSDEDRAYLLPNAVALRFTESADLLHLHHKLKMRLCYNAQEEIWRASRDEALQIVANLYHGLACMVAGDHARADSALRKVIGILGPSIRNLILVGAAALVLAVVSYLLDWRPLTRMATGLTIGA